MTQENETAKTLTLGDLLWMAITGFGERSHQANMVRMKIAEAPQGFDYQTGLSVYQAALLLTNSANQVPAQHVTVSRDLVRRAMIVLEQGGLNHGNVYSEFKEALSEPARYTERAEDQISQLADQLQLLGEALLNILVAADIVAPDVPVDGPHLLMAADDYTKALKAAPSQVARLTHQVDQLLAHCPNGECPQCSKIICPHGCDMHFHHDGCPACAELEGMTPEEIEAYKNGEPAKACKCGDPDCLAGTQSFTP